MQHIHHPSLLSYTGKQLFVCFETVTHNLYATEVVWN